MASTGQTEQPQPYIPAKRAPGEYPLIDNDPHFRRVLRYARRSDWYQAAGVAAAGPAAFWWMDRLSPSRVGKGGFASVMRLVTAMGIGGGFFWLYTTSIREIILLFYQSCLPTWGLRYADRPSRVIVRFYGASENAREVQMDMREMVDKVKKGEPLYGHSTLSPYMQGVASRNSRYTGTFLHIMPWFNVVNHEHHGVDTAKYYQQAERELAAEEASKTAKN